MKSATAWTSGTDGIYLKASSLGSQIHRAGELRIRVKPAVDFAALEAVLVVLNSPSVIPGVDDTAAADDLSTGSGSPRAESRGEAR